MVPMVPRAPPGAVSSPPPVDATIAKKEVANAKTLLRREVEKRVARVEELKEKNATGEYQRLNNGKRD